MEILNPMPPYNFAGIENPNYNASKVVIFPIPYDSATSYNSGARNGPHAIINASRNLEFYNEELDCDIQKEVGIYTADELMPNINSPLENINNIKKEIKLVLEDSKIPFIIGGDHSVALGAIKALKEHLKEKFSILHFDAHSDSRDEFMGSKYSHASVMARTRELSDNCYSVGVRSIDDISIKKYKDILFMKDIHKLDTSEIVKKILANLKYNQIYITFDFDVLDPSEVPSTGTPEPDGLHYYQLKEILKKVLEKRMLVGADFVEFAPIPGFSAPDFLAAKLIYTTIGYAFCKK
ncbi:MAG: agmatinase [Candidatus Micrarchaeia archaeon]